MFNLRIKAIPIIFCLGFVLVIAFYIWSTSYDPFARPSMDELQSNHKNALNDPLKTEEKLQQALLIATATNNIQLYPDDPQYYFERGNHYVGSGRQDLAVPDYSKAIALDPENVFYYW